MSNVSEVNWGGVHVWPCGLWGVALHPADCSGCANVAAGRRRTGVTHVEESKPEKSSRLMMPSSACVVGRQIEGVCAFPLRASPALTRKPDTASVRGQGISPWTRMREPVIQNYQHTFQTGFKIIG